MIQILVYVLKTRGELGGACVFRRRLVETEDNHSGLLPRLADRNRHPPAPIVQVLLERLLCGCSPSGANDFGIAVQFRCATSSAVIQKFVSARPA